MTKDGDKKLTPELREKIKTWINSKPCGTDIYPSDLVFEFGICYEAASKFLSQLASEGFVVEAEK